MSQARLLYLRIALVVFGLVFIFAVYPLTSGGHPAGRGAMGIRII